MGACNEPLDRNEVDVVKGLGIALVVMGHMAYPVFSTIHIYIYHMPLFFCLGGIGLGAKGIKRQVVSDLSRIVLYAVVMTAVYAVISKVIGFLFGVNLTSFKGIGIDTVTTKIVTENSHHVLLFLVGWFLVALFCARTLAVLLLELTARLVPPRLAPAVLLVEALGLCWTGMSGLAGRFHATHEVWANLGAQTAVAAGFILIGHGLLRGGLLLRVLRHPLSGFLLVLALYEAVVLLGVKPMSMAWSEYPAGVWRHLLGALLGIGMIVNIACLIARVRPDTLLAVIGRRSKAVMSHHLFVFLLVNLVLAGLGRMRLQDIGIWSAYEPQVLWPLYAALGLAVPLLFEELRLRALPVLRARWRGVGRAGAGLPAGD